MTTNAPVTSASVPAATPRDPTFARGLGLFDSVMVVVGVMIGSGIFIVSADMSRQIGSAGWLLVAWIFTGVLTIAGALSYGELAAMMPRAGGMYIYLREAFSPLWGFLYGWTLCTVIQTGHHCSRRHRLRALFRRALSVGFGISLPDPADPRFQRLRFFAFVRAARRHRNHRAAHLDQQPRPAIRQSCAKCVHRW